MLVIQVPAVGQVLQWLVLSRYSLDDMHIKSKALIPMPYISDLQMWSHIGPSKAENQKVVNVITSSQFQNFSLPQKRALSHLCLLGTKTQA